MGSPNYDRNGKKEKTIVCTLFVEWKRHIWILEWCFDHIAFTKHAYVLNISIIYF